MKRTIGQITSLLQWNKGGKSGGSDSSRFNTTSLFETLEMAGAEGTEKPHQVQEKELLFQTLVHRW